MSGRLLLLNEAAPEDPPALYLVLADMRSGLVREFAAALDVDLDLTRWRDCRYAIALVRDDAPLIRAVDHESALIAAAEAMQLLTPEVGGDVVLALLLDAELEGRNPRRHRQTRPAQRRYPGARLVGVHPRTPQEGNLIRRGNDETGRFFGWL